MKKKKTNLEPLQCTFETNIILCQLYLNKILLKYNSLKNITYTYP